MEERLKRFVLYLLRWQLSTPVLWLVISNLGAGLDATIIANLIGGSIFFWVDRFIFRSGTSVEWEVAEGGCSDCETVGRVRRLVLAPGGPSARGGYDRRNDPAPQYRCKPCSVRKVFQLRAERRVASSVSA
jgi:hypothetical protein